MAHHRRTRPRSRRAGCWCKWGKKVGGRELRGPRDVGHYGGRRGHGGLGARLRLTERAKEGQA